MEEDLGASVQKTVRTEKRYIHGGILSPVLVVVGCSGPYWATVLYWATLDITGLYWAVLGSSGLFWAVLCSTRLQRTLLGCTGLKGAVLG